MLTRFLEELHLGVIDDPHSDNFTVLTEMVTVCPNCRGMHSLRLEGMTVRCVDCAWTNAEKSSRRHARRPAA